MHRYGYSQAMNRRVARVLIDRWVDKNGPDGLLKLAQATGVSASTITKVRNGLIPKKQSTRDRLCNVLGELFPLVGASEEAS